MILTTDQLRVGDIVEHHGMRIKLDRPPLVWTAERRDGKPVTVYTFGGLVLNPEQAIAEHAIPRGWIYDSRGTWDYVNAVWRQENRPQWTVQGNHLARWSVVREHEIGC